jgi:hypothetical protein
MVLPAMPSFVQGKQVIWSQLVVFNVIRQRLGHTHRVKQNAIGVLQRSEFESVQLFTNIFCKAGTNHQKLVLVCDGFSEPFNIKLKAEFHESQITKIE